MDKRNHQKEALVEIMHTNGISSTYKIDTGRKINLIVESDCNRLKPKPDLCLVFICPSFSTNAVTSFLVSGLPHKGTVQLITFFK